MNKAKILFIDDLDVVEITYIRKTFQCDLKHAKNAEEALSFAKEMIPDLIILDLHFGDTQEKHGEEICQDIKKVEYLKDVPILVLTYRPANGHEEKKMFELGVDFFIHKPIDFDKLGNKIQKGLELSARRKKNSEKI